MPSLDPLIVCAKGILSMKNPFLPLAFYSIGSPVENNCIPLSPYLPSQSKASAFILSSWDGQAAPTSTSLFSFAPWEFILPEIGPSTLEAAQALPAPRAMLLSFLFSRTCYPINIDAVCTFLINGFLL